MPSCYLSFSFVPQTFAFLLLAFITTEIHAASSGEEPVIRTNFPDPCLAQSNSGVWYAFSTQDQGINIQLASSEDFTAWHLHEGYDALPTLPPWALPHPKAYVWAPDVNRLPSGDGWVMYFAAKHRYHPKKHCIGAATSPNITGPYTPLEDTMVCDMQRGGNIDPNLFYDPANGLYYLVYRVDGNTIGHGGACGNTLSPIAPTPLYLQQMSPSDLVAPIGDPVFLINNLEYDGFRYDGPNTERPSIAYRNETYYVLYNAQCYAQLTYRIDYVSCVSGVDTHRGISGCQWSNLKAAQQKWAERTLLKTDDDISNTRLHAPGSMDTSDDSRKMVFHGDTNLEWFNRKAGAKVQRVRAMYAGEIEYEAKTGDLKIMGLYQ
jgi:Glycosyl hydrolases family 43